MMFGNGPPMLPSNTDGPDDSVVPPIIELGEECASVSESTEPMVVERQVTEADVIWIVDSSFSMFDEAARVQENLNAFVDFVERSALDVRVVMVPVCNNLLGTACGGGLVVIGAAASGCQYIDLTKSTGGTHMSICTPPSEWPAIFTEIGTAVVESIPVPLPCDYRVPNPPSGESLDRAKVNVEYTPTAASEQLFGRVDDASACRSNLAWYYDDSAELLVSLCPESCNQVAQGGEMRILFGCDTVIIPPE